MFKTYVLFSKCLRHYYIGHTEDLNKRFVDHNKGKVRSTRRGIPWSIVYAENHSTRQDAHKRELQIKAYKGGVAFKKLINVNCGSVPK
ncbi:GIY-YIG nuclease family protein [Candidatus Falkowbacteria bacterium]|nr:GIY-YIG nuclease family protein [Candidatus Falkowbacteria bacterium]